MLTEQQKQEFIDLWRNGKLELRVTNTNIALFQNGVDNTTVPTSPIYNTKGWAANVASVIGGVRSKLVDATVQEAMQKGFQEAASMVPSYHVGHLWSPPSTIFGWAVSDPVRFAGGSYEGLSQSQIDQIIHNLIANDNVMFSLVGISAGYDGSTQYRGEKGSIRGFTPINITTGQPDFSPANPPGYIPNQLSTAFPQGYIVAGRYFEHKLIQEYSHHYIYDQWWDTQTDENVNRFWRSWLISVGVPIKLES